MFKNIYLLITNLIFNVIVLNFLTKYLINFLKALIKIDSNTKLLVVIKKKSYQNRLKHSISFVGIHSSVFEELNFNFLLKHYT